MNTATLELENLDTSALEEMLALVERLDEESAKHAARVDLRAFRQALVNELSERQQE